MKSTLACTLALLGLAFTSCASPAPDGPPTLGQSLLSDWNDAMDDAHALLMPSRLTGNPQGSEGLWQDTKELFDPNPGRDFGDATDRDYGWRANVMSKPSASYGLGKWALNYDPLDPGR